MTKETLNTHGLRMRAIMGTCINWNKLAAKDARLVFEYEQETGAMRVTSGRYVADLQDCTTDEKMLRLVQDPKTQITPQQLVDWIFCEWARGRLALFNAEGADIETPSVDGDVKRIEQDAAAGCDRMYSMAEALDYLWEKRGIHLSRRHLQKLILDGKIPEAQKIGKHGNSCGMWSVPKSWLDRYYKAKAGRPPRVDKAAESNGPSDIEAEQVPEGGDETK